MSQKNHTDPFRSEDVEKIVLRNGLRVLLLPDSSAPVAAVVTRVNAGYFDETDDVVGIAHVLEHMYFKGTEKRGVGDIARETKASGGYLNAHTIYDNTTYYSVLPASGLKAGLEIQSDAYAGSVISPDELAKELEVIIQEAKRKSDNPSAVAVESTYELLHDRHRIRRWRIGREDGLRKLTREQLVSFYRNFYKPSNTVLAIAGDFDKGDLLSDVERLYGGLGSGEAARVPGPSETETVSFRYREFAGDIAQTQVVVGWRTPHALHEDTPAVDFAASILALGRSSRLYRAVRERKLAASVSAHNYTPTELGVFTVHAEGESDTSIDAARAMWTEVRRLREEPPTDDEVQRVKNVFESRWMRRLETMEGKANYLAEWEGMGDWRLGSDYFNRILQLSAVEISAAAARYLVPEKAAVLVYRPESAAVVAGEEREMRSLLESKSAIPLGPLKAARITAVSKKLPVPGERGAAEVAVFRTPSGIPILVKKRASPIVYMEIQTMSGSAMENPADAGISSLAARTTVKGTARYSAEQIASLSEEMGGSIGVGASRDRVAWTFSVPTRFFSEGATLLLDVVRNATLADDAIETERHATLSGLAQLRDDMYAYPVRLATLAAFAGHPYGVPVSGTEESVRALSANQIREWYSERMQKNEWTFGIVGDVVPEDAAAVVSSLFEDMPQGTRSMIGPVTWPTVAHSTVETRDKAQTALALAFAGPGRNDPDRYVAALIATVASGLGGRFFDELRDKQSLAYSVHAFNASYPAGGMFLSYIATSPEKETAARDGLLEQFARFTQSLVSDEELERAKRYAIGTHAIAQESGANVLADIMAAFSLGGGLHELEEFNSSIQTVTAVQMREVARKYFHPDRRIEGIIRGIGRVV